MNPGELINFFDRHKIEARIDTIEDLAWVTRYHLELQGSQRISEIEGLSRELALSFKALSIRVIREREFLVLEVGKDVDRLVVLQDVLATLPTSFGGAVGVLGLDIKGEPLLLNLDSPDSPHLLVAGTTGCGKTELLKTLVHTLMWFCDSNFIIIDPKGYDFIGFKNGEGLLFPVQKSIPAGVAQIEWLVNNMQQDTIKKRTILIIDELADVLMVGGKGVLVNMTRLLQRGRSTGIHVIAATQKPLAQLVGSLMKSNFPVRAVGKVVSPTDSIVATGLPGMGAEKLIGGGDFLLIHSGEAIRFQVAQSGK